MLHNIERRKKKHSAFVKVTLTINSVSSINTLQAEATTKTAKKMVYLKIYS